MASARSTSCNVQSIQKSSIINQVPPDTHKSANNVSVLEAMRKIIKSRNEDSGLFSDPSIVKLGEGGYNDVFLVSSVSSLLARNEANFMQYLYIRTLIQIHSRFLFCGSRRKNAFSLTKY